MKQSILVVSLLGLNIGNAEPNWEESSELTTDWKTCSEDSDCAEGFACVKGLFVNTDEEWPSTGSYIGCNTIDVC